MRKRTPRQSWRFSYLSAILTLSLVAAVSAAETLEEFARFGLFADCRAMGIMIAPLDSDSTSIGLSKDLIQTAAESRLRSAQLYTSDISREWLYIHVGVIKAAYSISVRYYKPVYDPSSELSFDSPTWNLGHFGQHGGSSVYITSVLTNLLDRFLVDFLRVNETACEKR